MKSKRSTYGQKHGKAGKAGSADRRQTLISNREYRSTLFTAYFGIPENAAKLYEGMLSLDRLKTCEFAGDEAPLICQGKAHGTSIPDPLPREMQVKPEDILFATLEGVLYLARRNDLAFTVRRRVLVIGEHQATINRNMPLRSAIYYGWTMEKLIDPRGIYREGRIPIPAPEFYNGKKPQLLEQTLYLSDSYLEKTEHPMLELEVKVINITLSEGHPLFEACEPLYEYS